MSTIDDLNYARDSRTQGEASKPLLYMDDGTECELPMKWVVCPVCEGRGTHVNPSIDAGGLSSADFDEDPEFAEAYMAGVYDQTCNRCRGRRVVPEVDWDALTEEQRELYEAQLDSDDAYEAERRSEIMMGC